MMLMQLFLSSVAFASSFNTTESRAKLTSLFSSYPQPSRCETALAAGTEFDLPPNDAESGLVTKKMELNVENLLDAYTRGIFPWGQAGPNRAEWYNPPWRGVLELSRVHISRSDMKFIRKNLDSGEYEITFDQAFNEVIHRCATQARWTYNGRGEKVPSKPWLTELFMERYLELHQAGHAHSVEVWRNGELVAGLYGVYVNGMFSGESMFHDPEKGRDATKLAFYALIERLRSRGHTLIDTQMAVGLAGKWGARYIPRDDYQRRLKLAQQRDLLY